MPQLRATPEQELEQADAMTSGNSDKQNQTELMQAVLLPGLAVKAHHLLCMCQSVHCLSNSTCSALAMCSRP